MKIIRFISNIIVIIFIAGSGYYIYDNYYRKCRYPLEYDLGIVDNRFGISKDKFLQTITQSESVWESATGLNLFQYKSGASFKINLVFDQRQAQTIASNQSQKQIEGTRETYDQLVIQYDQMKSDYENKSSVYDINSLTYEQHLSDYNARVEAFNKKGGDKSRFEALKAEGDELSRNKSILDSQRDTLNSMTDQLNQLGGQVNDLAKKFNINVKIFNQTFGQAKEFEEGNYQRGVINIYQYDNIGELRLVLAHELGHSLDLEHVQNQKSIMYYLMDKQLSGQDVNNPKPSAEDMAELKTVCRI